MDVSELEMKAENDSTRLLSLIGSGDQQGLAEYVNCLTRTDLAWMVLSLGNGLLMQESENGDLHVKVGILSQDNEALENANISLFADRAALTAKLGEWRGIMTAPQRRKVAA